MSDLTQFYIGVFAKAAVLTFLLWGLLWAVVKIVVKFNIDAAFRGML